jgi:hypothetical protein
MNLTGQILVKHIEYHCSTCVLVTINPKGESIGSVDVVASNDSGKRFGSSCGFTFSGDYYNVRINVTK